MSQICKFLEAFDKEEKFRVTCSLKQETLWQVFMHYITDNLPLCLTLVTSQIDLMFKQREPNVNWKPMQFVVEVLTLANKG